MPANDCSYQRAGEWRTQEQPGGYVSAYARKRELEVQFLERIYQYASKRASKSQRLTHRESTEALFEALAVQWRRETAHLSAIPRVVMHPAYQQIIALGRSAVPFILKWMKHRPGYWFWALEMITRANPVRPEDAGNVREMKRAWLEWGAKNGLI